MNQFVCFNFFHACTLCLALTFVGIKSYEYHDKFTHFEIALTDGKFADGHVVEHSKDFDLAKPAGSVTIHGYKTDNEVDLMDMRRPEAAQIERKEITIPAAEIKTME